MNSATSAKSTLPFQLKKLSPKHKQVAALLAQGLGRGEIARIVKIVPEYVTMLAQQPLFIEYVKEMTRFTDVRLQALFEKSVDVVGGLLQTGSEDTKLRAAQTVMKAVGKDGTVDRPAVVQNFVVQLPAKSPSVKLWEEQHRRTLAPGPTAAASLPQQQDREEE